MNQNSFCTLFSLAH